MLNTNEGKPAVKNAADSGQVKKARKKGRLKREQELLDIEFLLKQPQGRRVMWRLLGHAKVFNSIWEPSAKIHYNAGRQDFGFWLLSELEAANSGYVLAMMQENKREEQDE